MVNFSRESEITACSMQHVTFCEPFQRLCHVIQHVNASLDQFDSVYYEILSVHSIYCYYYYYFAKFEKRKCN